MEQSSTGISGAVKIMLMFGVPAALASVIGLLIMPPHTKSEFIARTTCTVISSILFGPLLAIAIVAWQPEIITAAKTLATHTGLGYEELLTTFYILGPCQLIAGLPAWWILGAYMRWMAKMREEGVPDWIANFRTKVLGKPTDSGKGE